MTPDADLTPVAELNDVRVRYGAFEALKGVSLTVRRGERLALIGPSGSGKSTLARCLNGLAPVSTGQLSLFGRRVDDDTRAMRAARRRSAMIFQQFNLYGTRSVRANVAFALRHAHGVSRHDAAARAMRWLEAVDCAAFAERYPFQLSGGQRQRVAIARAMATEPELLILDEPTSALDPELVSSALALIERVARESGATLVCVTHELAFARRIADRIVFLAGGEIVEQGAPDVVLDAPKSGALRSFLRHVRPTGPAASAPGAADPAVAPAVASSA